MNRFFEVMRGMSRRRRIVIGLLTGLLLVAVFGFVNNSSWLAGDRGGQPLLLAHRGLAQTFGFDGITGDTCTAERIHPPEHPYLENTLASMRAAFDVGADVVELDVRLTADDRFAVFHDATLDCRTDGTGAVGDSTLEELQRLDIGYGYTADGGASYPFRGQGVGLIPSLAEVLDTFPDREFLIHVKSGDAVAGERLADLLSRLPAERLASLAVYGGDAPVATLERRLPGLRVMSRSILVACLGRYLAVGWTGYVPDACDNRQLHIPERYAPWLWGWPDVFLDRMEGRDTRVIVVAGSGGFSEGFDDPEDLTRLPPDYTGGVWTNRIDVVAPLLRGEAHQ